MKNMSYPSMIDESNYTNGNIAYDKQTPYTSCKLNNAFRVLGIKYVNETFNNEFSSYKIEKQNLEVMKQVSRFTCFINRDFFWEIIEKTPKNELYRDLIKKSGDQVYDNYGRGSHWYVEIAKYKLPIWQPGTIAYQSGMKKNTNLEINNKSAVNADYQKNGPIFDIEDCVFLAKFMTDVAQNYRNMTQSQGYEHTDFIPHIYSDSQLTTLHRLARYDAEHNGIVNELKILLTTFDPDIIELSEQENCLFNLNEFKVFEMLVKKVPTMADVKKFRKKNQFWYDWKYYFEHFAQESVFKEHIHEVKSCILKQPYIFQNQSDYAEMDRFFLTLLDEAKNHTDKKYFEGSQMDVLSNVGNNSGKNSMKNINSVNFSMNESFNFSEVLDGIPQNNLPQFDAFDLDNNRNRSKTDTKSKFSGISKSTHENTDQFKEFELDQQNLKMASQYDGGQTYYINNECYSNCYSFKNNDKLREYYMIIKRAIKRMGTDLMANKTLFTDSNYSKTITKIDKQLPLYGGLMKVGSCHPNNSNESEIVKQLQKMQSLYHKDTSLHKRLAYCMMLLSRNHILDYGTVFHKKESNLIGKDFIETLGKKFYTLPEIKAVRDLKFLEACILILLNTYKIEPHKKLTTKEYVEIILNEFVKYMQNQISPPPDVGEVPQDFKRNDRVDFPADVCEESKFVPVFLSRQVDEYYHEYIDRITGYLNNLKEEKLNEILGELNPKDARLSAAIKYLQKILEDKKSCVIF